MYIIALPYYSGEGGYVSYGVDGGLKRFMKSQSSCIVPNPWISEKVNGEIIQIKRSLYG